MDRHKQLISVEEDFQYSINIEYDLNDNSKLKHFIPTNFALDTLENVLYNTENNANNRAKIFVGAYGTGKSHVILMILSILMKKSFNLLEKLPPALLERPRLKSLIENYYNNHKRLLPVLINGSKESLAQTFVSALYRTLSDVGLSDILPETNFKSAVKTILLWKEKYPETYNKFLNIINIPVEDFLRELENYNFSRYKEFKQIYPELTSGSVFNPFLNIEVIDLYGSVIKSLKEFGYDGIVVVYDEFSKYLETSAYSTSDEDIKLLQDFAEYCNRSKDNQLHLWLVSHKEINNYIDEKFPKEKVDGWRGVSGRFEHINLDSSSIESYKLIKEIIKKDTSWWKGFQQLNIDKFQDIINRYKDHKVFLELEESEVKSMIKSCYPLQPITIFLLPRLSELVAQNERSLFTFLSSSQKNSFNYYLKNTNLNEFNLLTPDILFDYFEPLIRQESSKEEFYDMYLLTKTILEQLENYSLESKLVKTIFLISLLEHFDRLRPTKDELICIYSINYEIDDIKSALDNLINKNYVIHQRYVDQALSLKKSSGININEKISLKKEKLANSFILKEALNELDYNKNLYPNRYNDKKEIKRFFTSIYIDSEEIEEQTNWDIKSENIKGDGIFFKIIPKENENIDELVELVKKSSNNFQRYIFIIPTIEIDIYDLSLKLLALKSLMDESAENPVLYEEYNLMYTDLETYLRDYLKLYTRPELNKAYYINNGEVLNIRRRSDLNNKISQICEQVYKLTPIINNEALNKNKITKIARKSRLKILNGLLKKDLESNLGLQGYGQEVSIMRNTLIMTDILKNDSEVTLNLIPKPEGDSGEFKNLLKTIRNFIVKSNDENPKSFSDLYNMLTAPENSIGLRKGVIPIYLAVVLHGLKENVSIRDKNGQLPLDAVILDQIDDKPENYFIVYHDFSKQTLDYLQKLSDLFCNKLDVKKNQQNLLQQIRESMGQWYLSLPKYSTQSINDRKKLLFLNAIKTNNDSFDLLLTQLPSIFRRTNLDGLLIEDIEDTKEYFDNRSNELVEDLRNFLKREFISSELADNLEEYDLRSIVKIWLESLESGIENQLFQDDTNRLIDLFRANYKSEDEMVKVIAENLTGLKIQNWDDNIVKNFYKSIYNKKKTAEEFKPKPEIKQIENVYSPADDDNFYYEISINDRDSHKVRQFEKIETSKKSKLLYNAITDCLNTMGLSLSSQEKRQVLMNILEEFI